LIENVASGESVLMLTAHGMSYPSGITPSDS
jgi:hypothetical protein